ncbi:MAG: arylsulfatase [Planctomycetota bacterium]
MRFTTISQTAFCQVVCRAVLAGLALVGHFGAASAAEPASKPNIIFILADDVGYGDLGCYGATKIKTPNLDRIAREGTRFTDAHSPSSVCTPTRYALMTGQYAWRHRPGAGILSGVAPLAISPGTVTAPALLKRAGYATGVVGKWHLGLGDGETDYNREIKPGPQEIGFDRAFILPATGDRTPCVYIEDRRVVGYDANDPIRVNYQQKIGNDPTGKENPELLTNQKPSHGHDMTIVNGISRIGWMTGGKAARWVDEDMADTFAKKAVAFIEQHRERPFFLYYSTHDAHVPRVPHPRFRGSSGHGLRGDCIQQLDGCVGEVLATLDRLKLADNTLIVFTSDNGGVMDDGYQDGTGDDASGHSCNGVLRAKKGSLYEGGHRVPFVARWPGHVKAAATSGELLCHIDLLATLAAITGQPLPAEAGPDSYNVLPTLLGESKGRPGRDHLVSHTGGFPGRLALRQGPWKLIPAGGAAGANKNKKAESSQAELYRLDEDLAESKNLAAQHPDKVQELTARLAALRDAARTRP